MSATGPLTGKVLEYSATIRRLVPSVEGPGDWAPLAGFVAAEDFTRLGTFLETQDWAQYLAMLTGWASTIEAFETTVRRVSELGRLVYFEVEERHHRNGQVKVVNSMTAFEFDDRARIRRLDVYLQQAR